MAATKKMSFILSLLLALLSLCTAQNLSVPDLLPGTWQYVGCYTDIDRTIDDHSYTDNENMTIESCIAYCSSYSQQYAGTEFSQECYCGNNLASGATNVSESDCSMACKGNNTEPCGGPSRLSLFYSKNPVGPQPNPGVNDFQLIGCYSEGTTGRALTNQMIIANVTAAKCTKACKDAGYILAGVEYGGECYCDNQINNGGAPASSDGCYMLCVGNNTEVCGGPGHLDVYDYEMQYPTSTSSSTTSTSTTSSSLSTSSNPPSTSSDPPSTSSDPPSTSSAPASSSSDPATSTTSTSSMSTTSSAASVQSSTSWTSTVVTSSAASSSSSAAPTPTGPIQPTAIGDYTWYGCQTEASAGRALAEKIYQNDNMTLEICQATCEGYKYFGAEYSRECYCGNSFAAGSTSAPGTDCSMTCMANNLEFCGGPDRLSVYILNSTSSSSSTVASSSSSPNAPTPAGPTQPEEVGDYNWYGCQTEATAGRALFEKIYQNDNMTLEICQATCIGYKYFGAEYSRECYCGNSFAAGSTSAPNSDCSMTCMADKLEFCGGPNRLSVYSLNTTSQSSSSSAAVSSTSATASASTPAGPAQPLKVGKYSLYGCQTEATAGRALFEKTYANDNMTLEICQNICSGYTYFGAEYSRECYCGNSFAAGSVSAPESDCSMTCMANNLEFCGGPNRLSVYTINTDPQSSSSSVTSGSTSGTSSSISSAASSTSVASSSASSTWVSTSSSWSSTTSSSTSADPPPSSTTSSSTSSGSSSGSTSSSWSSATSSSDPAASSSGSTASSSTSVSSSWSSGASSSSVASSSSAAASSSSSADPKPTGPVQPLKVGDYNWYGCKTEATAGRALFEKTYANDNMTLEICRTVCDGYTYFGAEYSRECYCGNSFAAGSVSASSSDCSMTCEADAWEFCGGPNRLSVYVFNSSAQSSAQSSSSSSSVPASVATGSSSASATPTGPSQPLKVGNYNWYGCQTEATGVRALNGKVPLTGAAVTLEACQAYCQGYTYFGTEYSDECYCGNSFNAGSISATSTDCSMTCAANTLEFCGGPNRLSVYVMNGTSTSSSGASGVSTSATTGSAPAPPTPTGPTQPANIGPYIWYGCQTEATGARALDDKVPFTGTAVTLESCESYCAGYKYFGTEYSDECYCGNTFNAGSVSASNADCSMTCAANASEFCGGPDRLSVYVLNGTIPPASSTTGALPPASSIPVPSGMPAGWTYQGCWVDGAQGRILADQAPDSQTNSQEACAQYCNSLNYTVSGTEYEVQCFCGNFIENGGVRTSDSDCNDVCPGNSNEKCGSGGRLTIFSKGTPTVYAGPQTQTGGLNGSWTYQGCVEDNVNQMRTFFWQNFFPDVMTPNMCISRCAEYGYMAAGLEYGSECYCGDPANIAVQGATFRPEAECNIVCAGNASAICGGGSRLSTYFWTGDPLYSWDFPQDYRAGQYEILTNGPTIPLLTMQSITGKVQFVSKWGTGPADETGAYELDLSTLTWRTLHLKTDVFCSCAVILPDKAGRHLNVGGWSGESTEGVRLYWPDGTTGQWGTHDWQENVDELSLQVGRWYPSAMVMANGSIMVIGGEVGSNSAAVPSIEVLPFTGQAPLYMDWLDRTNPNNLYPFVCILPSGGIFVAYWNEARILSPVDFSTIATLPNAPGAVNDDTAGRTYPLEGTAVLMPQKAPYGDPLTILICGGSTIGPANALDNCVTTQPEGNQTWILERMPSFRVMPCIAPLPDGTYLVANGAHHGVAGFGLADSPNLNALLYDPTKPYGSRFTVMANTTIARLYHSEAITLLDGRVLISGSDPEDGTNPQEYRVEVFTPPYLLNGQPRPSFSIANTDWTYGGSYSLSVSGGSGAYSATLLGGVSSTHGNSMGGRTLMPEFSCGGGSCTVVAPPGPNIAPPGWYQLFVLSNGVPAVGTYVRIGGDPGQIGNWPAGFDDFTVPGV